MAEGARKVIRAAGTVAVRDRGGAEPEILLVHRPRYDDWSLPKGKLSDLESLPACAVRETFEESGVRARLGMPLDQVGYEVGAGDKTVAYWRASVVRAGRRPKGDEVDKIRWLPASKAVLKASYPEDPGLIRQALAMPSTTALIVVRHAKAVARDGWRRVDWLRPLAEKGAAQSRRLVALLAAYGVEELASSPSARCLQTLRPYARRRGLKITQLPPLSEEGYAADPAGAPAAMAELIRRVVASRRPLAVCGHRPVLPAMLAALGVP
ncbi:MAG: NUDIX hydrolase, partial [Propionibacteriaceae bacterium]|nr:NUDIX hydrolase [Propionibacteriaceae bacterium]